MKQTIEDVKHFMTTFGQRVLSTPTIPDQLTWQMRVALLVEEVKELEQALKDNDLVEVLDALTDIQYVLDGAYLAFGLQDLKQPAFDEVQRSNMSKLTKEGTVLYREDGKILKSDQYSPPDLKSILDNYLIKQLGKLIGEVLGKDVEMYGPKGKVVD